MSSVEVAMQAARLGAEVLLRHWQQLGKNDADLKARNDWVSSADRESEAVIISYIREQYPDDSFLGEESGAVPPGRLSATPAKRRWIIDPLDGTSNYLQHFPYWSVSIGLEENDEMIAGVIYDPLGDQMFAAERGAGAFLDDRKLTISNQRRLEGSFLATGFPFRAQKHVKKYCSIFEEVLMHAKGVRRSGSAALDLAFTASGVFDGFFELNLAIWDIAPGVLMIREAGGVVTDFSGGEEFWSRGNIVAGPAELHRELLGIISRHVVESELDR